MTGGEVIFVWCDTWLSPLVSLSLSLGSYKIVRTFSSNNQHTALSQHCSDWGPSREKITILGTHQDSGESGLRLPVDVFSLQPSVGWYAREESEDAVTVIWMMYQVTQKLYWHFLNFQFTYINIVLGDACSLLSAKNTDTLLLINFAL